MDKNLISEIHRIHEMMGVKSKNLLMESSCPFCVKFLKEIDDLIDLLKKNDLDLAGFTSKIDELERKIDDMALSINEKTALKTKIQKAKSTGITDGDTFRSLLKQEFDNTDQFGVRQSSALDSADATKIDTVAVMKDPETAQLSFNSPNSKKELAEIELSFTKAETEIDYKKAFSTLDDVANFYDNYFRELLIKKGYPKEFIDNYVSIWRNWVKNNETLKKWYSTPNELKKSPAEGGSGAPIQRTIVDADQVDDPYRQGPFFQKEYLRDSEPEIYDKYNGIIKKNGVDVTDGERKLLDDLEKWKNGENVDFTQYKNKNVNQEEVPTVNATDFLRTQETKNPGFLSKFGDSFFVPSFTKTVSDIIRSYFGTKSSDVYRLEVEKSLNKLIMDFGPKFDAVSGKLVGKNVDEVANVVRQLLMDLKLSKNTNESWGELWQKIEDSLRIKGQEMGITNIDEFIGFIKKGGGEKGTDYKSTIEYFLKTMDEIENTPQLFKVFGDRRWALSSGMSFSDWNPLKKLFKEFTDEFDNKVIKNFKRRDTPGFFKGLWGIVSTVTSQGSGLLLYAAPRKIQTIIKDLRFMGITNNNLLKSLINTYISMCVLSLILVPLATAVMTFFATLRAETGLDWSEASENFWQSGYNTFIEKITSLSVLNPFGGWSPAYEIGKAIWNRSWKSPKKVAEEKREKWRKETEKLKSETIKKLDKNAENKFNELPNDKQQEIYRKLNYDILTNALKTNNLYNQLTSEEAKLISRRLKFKPSLDREARTNALSDFNDLSFENVTDFENFKKTVDEKKLDKGEVIGNMVLVGSSGKEYLVRFVDESTKNLIVDPENKYLLDGHFAWIKPDFNSIFIGTKETGYSLKQFAQQYKNL
jgi:hypothetical protein